MKSWYPLSGGRQVGKTAMQREMEKYFYTPPTMSEEQLKAMLAIANITLYTPVIFGMDFAREDEEVTAVARATGNGMITLTDRDYAACEYAAEQEYDIRARCVEIVVTMDKREYRLFFEGGERCVISDKKLSQCYDKQPRRPSAKVNEFTEMMLVVAPTRGEAEEFASTMGFPSMRWIWATTSRQLMEYKGISLYLVGDVEQLPDYELMREYFLRFNVTDTNE